MTLDENDPSVDGEVIIVRGIPAHHFILAGLRRGVSFLKFIE